MSGGQKSDVEKEKEANSEQFLVGNLFASTVHASVQSLSPMQILFVRTVCIFPGNVFKLCNDVFFSISLLLFFACHLAFL